MKYKKIVFFSIAFVAVFLFQFPKVVEAVNYNTEIGLTFNSDVASGSESTSSSTSEGNTSITSESTTDTSSSKKELPETAIKKITKSGIDKFLPNTGTTGDFLYLIFGSLILVIIFTFVGFKFYKVFQKNARK
ncbi:LPXTG cell wall anchor domain-containing protein [Enterococcus rotai]|uniref:LPXTG cell wall anchor domain-containing protein n=1 Tax=Enterococcus rotai TaxID=118060 RepID=UPI0035C67435